MKRTREGPPLHGNGARKGAVSERTVRNLRTETNGKSESCQQGGRQTQPAKRFVRRRKQTRGGAGSAVFTRLQRISPRNLGVPQVNPATLCKWHSSTFYL